jgi:hypothetical protein
MRARADFTLRRDSHKLKLRRETDLRNLEIARAVSKGTQQKILWQKNRTAIGGFGF